VALPMAAQVQADEMEVEPHSHPATYDHDHKMEDGSMSPMHGHKHESHPHSELHSHSSTALYGSIRAGFQMNNPEGDGTFWNVGNAENSLGSRIGVTASHDLGGGVSTGVVVEKSLGSWGTRHQNVWVAGPAGKVTIGQQWTTYYLNSTIDGAFFLGGNTDSGLREQGIKFASSLGGPFNFEVFVRDDNETAVDTKGEVLDHGEGLDVWEVAGKLNVGGVVASVAYRDIDEGNELIGVVVGGTFGGLQLRGGFSTTDSQISDAESERFALWAAYGVSESGTVYLEYEDLTSEAADGTESNNDWLLLGYKHTLADGVQAVAEFSTPDTGVDRAAVALVLSF
jgi:predicted porin